MFIKLDPFYYLSDKFIIKPNNNSSENCYIHKAELNGLSLGQFWFKHSDLAAAGVLELWLGSEPNKKMGCRKASQVTF